MSEKSGVTGDDKTEQGQLSASYTDMKVGKAVN